MSSFRPQNWNGVPIPYEAPVCDLRGMTASPGPAAWAAIKALAEKGSPESLTALVELARSHHQHVRRSAVEAIGVHVRGNDAADVVFSLLQDGFSFVVRAACEAASNLGLWRAHGRVLELVSDPEAFTRITALRALENLWMPADFETVFNRYDGDSSPDVRKQAAWTLHKNAAHAHWQRMLAAWSADPIPRHRVWACEIADRFGDTSSLQTLRALEADRDGHVRRAATRAAAKIDLA